MVVRTAVNVLLRRATKSLLPFASGAVAVASRRTITNLIGVQHRSVLVRNFPPAGSRFFSISGAARNREDILRSIIAAEPPEVFGIPVLNAEGLTFSKEPGATNYYKEYNGEIVRVEVISKSFLAVCILRREERTVLVLFFSTLDSQIGIHFLSAVDLKLAAHINGVVDLNHCDDDAIDYHFRDLDEELQGALVKYLVVRGITADWYVKNQTLYFR